MERQRGYCALRWQPRAGKCNAGRWNLSVSQSLPHTSHGTSEPFSCDEGSVLTGTWVTGEFTSEVTFEVVDETCGNRVVSLGEFGNEIDYTVGPCSFATNESTAMKHDISTRKRGKGGDHITCACVCPVGTCDTPADKDKPACADCASCYAGDTDPCAKST